MAATLSGSCGVLGLETTIVDVVRLGDGDTLGLGVVVFGLISGEHLSYAISINT